MDKRTARTRRAKSTRKHLKEIGATRLVVFRSARHIYAQVIDATGKVISAASTVEKEIAEQVKYTGNIEAAAVVGKFIAKRALEAGVESLAFDRSGFKYHGRVKSLADAARNAGLQF